MKKLFFAIACIAIINTAGAQLSYAEKLAATIMNTYKDSMVVKKFAAHLLQDNQVLPGQTIEQAQRMSISTGRRVILRLRFPNNAPKLEGHFNQARVLHHDLAFNL